MQIATYVVCLCISGGVTFAQMDEKPIQGKATVELKFDKKQYYLGEACRVEFVLKNTDDKDISYSSGADYRGVNRALRFRVQAVDADGTIVPEADPPVMWMGGLGGTRTLKPGEEWQPQLWPLDYLRLTKPGKYTFRITHDLGWNGSKMSDWIRMGDPQKKTDLIPKDWKAPVGEAQIEFLMPDPRQAEKILETISAELKKDRDDPSRRVPSPEDLAFPVYLPLLKKRAMGGESYFLQALGEIPSKEATLTLMELAETKDFADASSAAYCLSQRMPFEWNTFFSSEGKRQRMLSAAWEESYAPRARTLARKLVDSFDPNSPGQKPQGVSATGFFRGMVASEFRKVDLGARMLASVGTAEDDETLRTALDKAFVLTRNPRGENDNILDLPAPMPDLIRALDAIYERSDSHDRGIELGACKSPAEIYLSFHWLAKTPPPRPTEWTTRAKAHINDNYPTQMAILEPTLMPMTPECRDLVAQLLTVKDHGVLMKACEVVGKSNDKTLLPPVLAMIKAKPNDWLFSAACDAATKLGAKRELAEAAAEQLSDQKLFYKAQQVLLDLVMDKGPNGGRTDLSEQDRLILQRAWREFIARHGDDIDAGKKYKVGDDEEKGGLPRILIGKMTWNGWPKE